MMSLCLVFSEPSWNMFNLFWDPMSRAWWTGWSPLEKQFPGKPNLS